MADAGTTLQHASSRHRAWRSPDAAALARLRKPVVAASLMAGDVVVACGSIAIGRALMLAVGAEPLRLDYLPAGLLILTYVCIHFYTGCGPSPYERFRMRALGVVGFVAANLIVGLHEGRFGATLFASTCTALFLLICGHYIEAATRAVLVRFDLWGAPSILVGCGGGGRKLAQQLLRQPALGLKPVGFIGAAGERAPHETPLPWFGSLVEPSRISRRAEFLIFTSANELHEFIRTPQALMAPHRCLLVEEIHDVQSLWLRTRMLGGLVGLEIRRDLRRRRNRVLKRAIDILIGMVFALLATPIILVLGLAVKLVDGGPCFYVQDRVGRNGSKLPTLKLRTMRVDAERRLEEHLARDPQARAEWQRFFKLDRDPRILPIIGNFMRRTSLDELPQLWNVIRGDMSLVGPRPFPTYHMNGFDEDFRAIRASVPPGITGMWQVSCRGDGDLEAQKAQDLFYIRNWSIWLDVYILLQTVPVVLGRRGAK